MFLIRPYSVFMDILISHIALILFTRLNSVRQQYGQLRLVIGADKADRGIKIIARGKIGRRPTYKDRRCCGGIRAGKEPVSL